MSGRVQTVRGPIDPAALGATLMHEHVLCDITPPAQRPLSAYAPPIGLANRFEVDYGRVPHAGKTRLADRDLAADELRRFRADGGGTVVDVTSGGLAPDPAGLAEVSARSGVHIVMGCGHYVEAFQDPANRERGVEEFAREIVAQLRDGAWGTDIRAGIIGEIGCQVPWTAQERRVLHGAVLAQLETGAALTVHPGADPDQPFEIAAAARAWGGDLGRTILGHIDRTIFDEDRLLRLAETGCTIEFDLFGYETSYWPLGDIDMPNDGARLRLLDALRRRGLVGQILISQDICRLTRLVAFGGHGYGHILRNVVPLMARRGYSDADIRTILHDNPRRLLTIPQRNDAARPPPRAAPS